MGLYASTKHALEDFSESLDHEVRGFGVRVILIQPTFTNTLLDINAVKPVQRIDSYSTFAETRFGCDHSAGQEFARPGNRRR